MVRNIFRLAILFVVAFALYHFVPTWWHYQQFKDAVHETALFGNNKPDAQLIDQVMDLAAQHDIPLAREYVQVRHVNYQTYIDASWVQTIKWLPGYERPWQFEVGDPSAVVGRAR